jgi:lysophospholipase L1-like esterase
MDEAIKITLLVSSLLNILFVGLGSVFAAKKGGVTYLIRKLLSLINSELRSAAMYDNPFYRDKKSHYETLPKTESEIIFLGDSLTDLCEWAELFRDDRIKNRGICGDTTDGVLNRITETVKSKPEKLFIMIGINDLNQGRGVEYILDNYKNILEIFKADIPGTKVFIQSLLPVNNQIFKNNAVNEKIRLLNANLKELAEELSFQYIDLFSSFLDSNNQLDAQYTSDGVHLNGEGYLIWKKTIEKYVS